MAFRVGAKVQLRSPGGRLQRGSARGPLLVIPNGSPGTVRRVQPDGDVVVAWDTIPDSGPINVAAPAAWLAEA